MKNRIIVETEKLKETSTKLEANSYEFDETCNRLYEVVENMKTNWSGKDNVAFVNELLDYKQELVKIGFLLRQYAQFLKYSADSYCETQEELYATIVRLRR